MVIVSPSISLTNTERVGFKGTSIASFAGIGFDGTSGGVFEGSSFVVKLQIDPVVSYP